ncbi:hypothetical protein AVEN_109330-1 [Araneus ventricosus]|uniref:Uncharacterized protein n=1 Tax=Araneus ventricosus TaxID=182803 RepID=A0A4Y2D360_ARAVE|nr:hypothetical protein AVEN_109330-1 [Araneus ventricosus]
MRHSHNVLQSSKSFLHNKFTPENPPLNNIIRCIGGVEAKRRKTLFEESEKLLVTRCQIWATVKMIEKHPNEAAGKFLGFIYLCAAEHYSELRPQ